MLHKDRKSLLEKGYVVPGRECSYAEQFEGLEV